MRNVVKACVALALLAGGAALAVSKGGTLYIKTKDTKVLKTASPSAASVTTLQPGSEVVWNGPDAKDKTFHSVKTKDNKSGFVLQANLSPTAPKGEFDSTGKPMDKEAFASSGAATKALTEAGVKYAESKSQDVKKIAAQLIYVEEHSKVNATADVVAKQAKTSGVNSSAGGAK